MNAKLITYILISIILISSIYIVYTKYAGDLITDFFDDIIDPDDVLYLKYRVEIYQPLIGGGDWQVSIPEQTAYFNDPGRGWSSWFGNTELRVIDLLDKTYSIKFDHGSWGGFTSTKYPVVETSIKSLAPGTYPYTLELYIEGDLKYSVQTQITVVEGTGQIIMG